MNAPDAPNRSSSRPSAFTGNPLHSILTVACAAAIVPAVSDAAVVVLNDLNGITVGMNYPNQTPVGINLPGGARLEFAASQFGASENRVVVQLTGGLIGQQSSYRSLTFSGTAGFRVAFRTAANSAVNWDNAASRNGSESRANIMRVLGYQTYGSPGNLTQTPSGLYTYTGGYPGAWSYRVAGPGSFSDKFLLFTFDNGGVTNYGWVEMTVGDLDLNFPSNLSVTLGRVAYSDSPLGAGVVIPEPASAALAMGGALVLGAAGLRRWRTKRGSQN